MMIVIGLASLNISRATMQFPGSFDSIVSRMFGGIQPGVNTPSRLRSASVGMSMSYVTRGST